MTTNEYERDFNDQSALKRPGRLDFRTLNNVDDAGDGNPGVQRAMRNYIHEGGMEKDIDLVANGIKGTSVDISNAELQQLSNITSATISSTQWGYLGELDQPLKQSATPTFAGLNSTENISLNNKKITSVADPTANQDVATKNFIINYFPIGVILMYKGTGWVDNSTIPGWYKCDGSNGTPDLVDKFIRSEASSGNEGGSDDAIVVTHNHTASQGTHVHNASGYTDQPADGGSEFRPKVGGSQHHAIVDSASAGTITIGDAGSSGTGANKPVYYSLIFIMRVS